MKIDRKLFLTQTIETPAGEIYLHSAPISMEVWKAHFYIISQAYTAIFMGGLGAATGPTVAALMLEQVATQAKEIEKYQSLMMELRRLTNVAFSANGQWQAMPFEAAIQRGMIDEEARMEAENAICFFICASSVLRGPRSHEKLMVILGIMSSLWDAQLSSLDITEFTNSLQTSTTGANTGEKKPGSLVPS